MEKTEKLTLEEYAEAQRFLWWKFSFYKLAIMCACVGLVSFGLYSWMLLSWHSKLPLYFKFLLSALGGIFVCFFLFWRQVSKLKQVIVKLYEEGNYQHLENESFLLDKDLGSKLIGETKQTIIYKFDKKYFVIIPKRDIKLVQKLTNLKKLI